MPTLSAAKWLELMQTQPSSFWARQETKARFNIFQKLFSSVPAYKSFIQNSHFKHTRERLDETRLPAISKKNYFRTYTADQCRVASTPTTITATSGSTGMPVYFYRDEWLDFTYSVYLESFFKPYKNKRTLFIDCFGMGVWIGGLLTFTALKATANRGYLIDVITPGVSTKDIFAGLKNLALLDSYDSIVLAGYPPFIKDVIDNQDFPKSLKESGKLRFIFAAESFTEGFRGYMVKQAKLKNYYLDTMNIYGSAELGAMAVETPLSILCRELAMKNKVLSDTLLPGGKIPTMAQYNPAFVSFFEREERLLVSGDSITPFLHYDIGDTGKVFSYAALESMYKSAGLNLVSEARKLRIPISQLPFVLVYERSDFSTSIYGLQIYPQHIKQGLEKYVDQGLLTGKFLLSTKLDRNKNQFLEIKVELANSKLKLSKDVGSHVREILLSINSEYRELSKYLSQSRLTPHIIPYKKGDPAYFPTGIKQKWV